MKQKRGFLGGQFYSTTPSEPRVQNGNFQQILAPLWECGCHGQAQGALPPFFLNNKRTFSCWCSHRDTFQLEFVSWFKWTISSAFLLDCNPADARPPTHAYLEDSTHFYSTKYFQLPIPRQEQGILVPMLRTQFVLKRSALFKSKFTFFV